MTQDYEWLRKRQDEMRSRRAAQYDDEEPDEDALALHDRFARDTRRRAEDAAQVEARKDRGLDQTPRGAA